MVDFARLRSTAQRLIDANGRTVVLTRQGSTPTDLTKPWRGQAVPATESVTGKAVFVDPREFGMGYATANQQNEKRADQFALFAAANDDDLEIETFDTMTDSSRAWKIHRADLLAPGDLRMLYVLEVSR